MHTGYHRAAASKAEYCSQIVSLYAVTVSPGAQCGLILPAGKAGTAERHRQCIGGGGAKTGGAKTDRAEAGTT